jgi:transcriptional regulator with XRE-family HTH domain
MFHIGDVVRKLRLARGWTIPELADRAGLNKQTVSNIERGDNYTRDSLTALALALGLPSAAALESRLDDWAEARIGPTVLRADWHELLSLWEVLDVDPRAKQLLLALIRREAEWVAQSAAAGGVEIRADLRPARKPRSQPGRMSTPRTDEKRSRISSSTASNAKAADDSDIDIADANRNHAAATNAGKKRRTGS